jgi:hypothetical protein
MGTIYRGGRPLRGGSALGETLGRQQDNPYGLGLALMYEEAQHSLRLIQDNSLTVMITLLYFFLQHPFVIEGSEDVSQYIHVAPKVGDENILYFLTRLTLSV